MEDDIKKIESKEEFQKHKDEIVKRLDDAIANGRPFLVIAEGENDTMATAGGDLHELTRIVGISAQKALPIKTVLKYGLKFNDHLNDENRDTIFASVKPDDLATEVVDQLGCEDCPTREECEIFNLAMKDVKGDTVAEFVKALKKKHPELADLVQTKTPFMSKGGDA